MLITAVMAVFANLQEQKCHGSHIDKLGPMPWNYPEFRVSLTSSPYFWDNVSTSQPYLVCFGPTFSFQWSGTLTCWLQIPELTLIWSTVDHTQLQTTQPMSRPYLDNFHYSTPLCRAQPLCSYLSPSFPRAMDEWDSSCLSVFTQWGEVGAVDLLP